MGRLARPLAVPTGREPTNPKKHPMKNPLQLILLMAVFAMGLFNTSCQAKGLITQDDAKAVGKVLAKHALDIVNDAVSGQKIDVKLVATEAGLDVANLAFQLAEKKISDKFNLAHPASLNGQNCASCHAASDKLALTNSAPICQNTLVNQEAERIVAEALSHAKAQVESTLTNAQDASFAGQVLSGSAGFALAALDAK